DGIGRLAVDALAHELDGAAAHRLQAEDGLEQRALARAVGTQQGDELAGGDVQAALLERLHAAVIGVDAVDLKHAALPRPDRRLSLFRRAVPPAACRRRSCARIPAPRCARTGP